MRFIIGRSMLAVLLMVAFFGNTTTFAQQETAQPNEATDQTSVLPVTEQFPDKLEVVSKFYLGKITEISNETETQNGTNTEVRQDLKIRLTSGEEKGKEIEIKQYFSSTAKGKLRSGESVVVNKSNGLEGETYYIADKYRLPPAAIIAIIFFVLAVFFAGKKGLGSIIGLIFSILILVKYIVPQILAGQNPLLVSIVGALMIAFVSLYVAHGFNRRTSIALGGTLITLVISFVMAVLFVNMAKLYGAGSEEAFFLQLAPGGTIDLRGLLLGGIVIGALGVLDDITTAQVAAVQEIHRANPKLTYKELYASGISVGREHIASLVNTLVLAYVGASFPLFLLFTINQETTPLWVTLNSEFIMEEIIRTLVGSTALIFAVPISTFLATYFFIKSPVTAAEKSEIHHIHSHG